MGPSWEYERGLSYIPGSYPKVCWGPFCYRQRDISLHMRGAYTFVYILREETSLYRRKIEVYLESSLRSILWYELHISIPKERGLFLLMRGVYLGSLRKFYPWI
jgi:hypothetical protein